MNMNINSCFPSKYLKADDLMGQDISFTVREIKIEDVGGEERGEEMRPIVYFYGLDKGLVLNKTNAGVIAQLYTPETDMWMNKGITLYSTEVQYGGKTTLGLRVRLRPAQPSNAPYIAQAAAAAVVPIAAPLTVAPIVAAPVPGPVNGNGHTLFAPQPVQVAPSVPVAVETAVHPVNGAGVAPSAAQAFNPQPQGDPLLALLK
jgi:hypothetical protein